MYYHFSTIAHEFQHMISWNYNKTNLQWTFIKEGCSLAAEVINGFPLYDEQYFSREPNHYLFDWRSSSDVTTDYSRSSKFHTYLYNQFGAPLFKDIVQSGIVGMDSYNHALTAVGSTLRMDDVIANWFVANCIDDRKFDAAYGYTSNITTTLRSTIKHLPEGTVAKTIEPYAVEYIILGAKDNISAEFTTSGPNIKIRALFSGNSGRKIVNVNTNSVFSDPEFGKKYENCIFIVSNIGSSAQGSFECKLSGNPTVTELKWYSDKANARNVGNAKDISGVCYNSLPGGKLDSVKIAVDRKGLISIKIFRIPAKYGQKPTSGSPVAITNEYTMQSTATHTYPYLYPFPYWFTIDLRKDNISTDEPFLIGISVPEDTANYPMVMMSLPNGYDDISTYKYWNNGNYWSYLAYPTTKMIMVPMLSAFVSFKNNGASKVNEVSPITYSLSQNYPNPFNPETSISFSIPKRGLTAIKIYDVMGREVKTLMNEVMEAGDHIVKFSAANLSSGLYFYKIQCDDFVDTKKMVLLR
jgi:hypothetical protein